jgi:alpha-L-rhamnosidase
MGMDKVELKPFIAGELQFAKGYYESIRGRISSEWQKEAGGLDWKIVIPPNIRARIFVPAASAAGIYENGRPVQQVRDLKFIKQEDGFEIFEAVSGSYHFIVRNPPAAINK